MTFTADTLLAQASEARGRCANLTVEDVEAELRLMNFRISIGDERIGDCRSALLARAMDLYVTLRSAKKRSRLLLSLYCLTDSPEEIFPRFERLWDEWLPAGDTDAATASYMLCLIDRFAPMLSPTDPMTEMLRAELSAAASEMAEVSSPGPAPSAGLMTWPGLSLSVALHRLRFVASSVSVPLQTRQRLVRHYTEVLLSKPSVTPHRLILLTDLVLLTGQPSLRPSLHHRLASLLPTATPHLRLSLLSAIA